MTEPDRVAGPTVLLRPEDAAAILNVRKSWIYEAVRTGNLPCVRVGRHIRFTTPMLDNWIAQHCTDVR